MVTLQLLGRMRLTDSSGKEVLSLLSQPKRMAVLTYLALAGRRAYLHRDLLLGLFWPESDTSHARNALNQVLHALRRDLGEGALRSRSRADIGLEPDHFNCDVWSFLDAVGARRYREALEVYRGELLPGFYDNGNGEFQRWLEGERERLREAAAGANWSLAGEQIRRGEVVEAERTAQRAMDLVCTDESPVRGFIQALARAGDRAAAVNFYERFSSRLREKLELDPCPETVEVVEGIRNGTMPPGADARAPEPAPEKGAPSREDGLCPVGFPDSETGPRRDLSPEPGGGGRIRLSMSRAVRPWMAVVMVAFSMGILWPPGRREPDPSVVAAAPFSNRTTDPEMEDLGRLVAANIQFGLNWAGIGKVTSQPAVEHALAEAGAGSDPLSVLSREVGAGIVVTGDIFLQDDSLLIRAYCTDARTGKDLHPISPIKASREEEAEVVREVQGRVAAVLAQHLDAGFALDPDLAPPPVKLEAYQEYRRGFEVYRLGGTHEDALVHFQRAWELDPDYLAPPLRILALYSNRPQLRREYDSILTALKSSRSRMTPYQRRYFDGIRLAGQGNLELAYREFVAMAEIGRLQAAASLAEMALLTNRPGASVEAAGWLDKGSGEFLEPYVAFWPGYWSFYTYSLHLAGQFEKELEIAREWKDRFPSATYYPVQAETKALVGLGRLEPLDAVVEGWRREKRLQAVWDLSDELRVHGHAEAARILLEEEVRRFETDSAYVGRSNNQAMVLHRLGRDEEAHLLWESGIRLDRPDPWPWGVARIGFSAALSGDSAQARAMEALLLTIPGPREGDYTPFLQAKIAAALGEKDRAVAILSEWARRGSNLAWLNNLHRDFTLRSLLGDYPPFQELMRPKG